MVLAIAQRVMPSLRKRERAHVGAKSITRVAALRSATATFTAKTGTAKAKAAPRRAKTPYRADPKKAISVMAWIEDAFGHVLLVKQERTGMWALPGGKVRSKESLLGALRREVKEELGVEIDVATPIDLYDRPQKEAFALLFRVILRHKVKMAKAKSPKAIFTPRAGEIAACLFHRKLPVETTPSLAFFWKRAQRTFEPLALFR